MEVASCFSIWGWKVEVGYSILFDVNDRVEKTIEYFKENNIRDLYSCHCTSFDVKTEIHKAIKIKDVGVGMVLEW